MVNRFEEVAELIDVCWLDIIATIDCRELSLNTTYTAYLVFGLNDRSYGLDSETQEACITIAGEVSARHTVSLHDRARSQRRRLGSRSRYWLQHHQWENEEDNKNEDDEEVEEEEDDHLWVEDKEDDEHEDSEEEDDSDIDVEEDENEDEEEEEEDDDDMEVEEDKDIENEENETEEEEKYNVELEKDDGEEEESDNELEEEENDFQHFDLPTNTARRMERTPPDIGGSSDLPDSLEDEQEEDAVRYPRARADGWMEVTMGDFYNGNLDDGTIEIRLMEHRSLNWKSGLIVEGVEIRPKIQCDKQAATS